MPPSKIAYPLSANWPITQPFGANPDIYKKLSYDGVPLKGHNGIDFGCPTGTPVLACGDGTVIEVGDVKTDTTGYGTYVKLSHAWGESIYGHQQRVLVALNQHVTLGQQIGISDNTGNSSGAHLHFGIRINPYSRTDGWGGYSDPMPYLTREIGIQDCTQFTVAGDTRPLGWFRDQYWAAMKTLADTQNQLKAAQSQVSQLQNQLKQQGSAIQLQQEVAQLQNQLQATQNNLNFQVRELKGQTDLWRQGLEHVLRDYADPLAPTTPNLDPVLQIRQLLDGKNKRLAGQPVHSVQTSVAATDERQSPAAPPAFAPAMDPSASTGTPSGPSQVEDLTLANASPSTAATGPTVPGSDAFDGPIFVGDEGLAAPPAGTQGGVAASHVPGMPSLAEDGQNSTGSLATAGSAQGDAAGVGLVDRPKPLGPEGGTSVPSGIAAGELIDGEEIGPTAPLEAPPAVVPQAVTALDDVPPRTVNDVVPLTPAVRVLDQQADPSSSSKRRRARRSVQPPSNNLPPDSEPPDAFDPSV